MIRRDWDVAVPASALTALELAWGFPIGTAPDVTGLVSRTDLTPRQAFETVVVRALQRPPCVVSFSGGRDSSVTLAIATEVARREGLPLPIPASHRFTLVEDSDESAWQEFVIDHLGLTDWQILHWTDELDSVGPYAQATLRTVGLTAPSNQHFLLPLIELASGGSLLTGVSGDELFELRARPIANRFLHGTHRIAPRELHGLAAGLSPLPLRVSRAMRRHAIGYDWIEPAAMTEISRRVMRWLEMTPLRYDRALTQWLWPSRLTQDYRRDSARLGSELHDVQVEHPFSSPEYIAAFAGDVGASGPLGRARGLRALAGDLLPGDFFSRTTKASFSEAFTNRWTREFARAWGGGGLETVPVDAEALRAQWLSPHPEPHCLLLLQAAWLSTQPP